PPSALLRFSNMIFRRGASTGFRRMACWTLYPRGPFRSFHLPATTRPPPTLLSQNSFRPRRLLTQSPLPVIRFTKPPSKDNFQRQPSGFLAKHPVIFTAVSRSRR